ncbi:unnamed protein product [Lactuca virosa]|uniref:Replication factor A C-terminal domain-containing protein n=1 Tax=Lactuca virosa TaxID=75947 RepID=A0AAU9P6R1_9ASTR|nr:unnamed protein product [Lactuca virosa]
MPAVDHKAALKIGEKLNLSPSLRPIYQPNTSSSPVTICWRPEDKIPSYLQQPHVMCTAQIKELYAHRTWYYVHCSKCPKKLYQEDDTSTYFVCEDHEDIQPKFKYCINASITNATGTSDVIFFNEVMTEMLNINCEDMVVKHGYIDSKILPPLIISQIGIPHHFHLTLNPDHTIVVNRITQLIDNRSGRKSIHLPSLTPDPKPKRIQPPPPANTSQPSLIARRHDNQISMECKNSMSKSFGYPNICTYLAFVELQIDCNANQ